jgi:6-phosphogluconolactonase
MGTDGHTASIFPNSPLLAIESGDHFAPVDVPEKGWRFSLTPDGLRACGKIVVVVTGTSKLHRLKKVLEGPEKQLYPIQILSRYADKVEWLVDEAAGDLLTLK